MDKPLPGILKATLKKAREMLLQKNIITESPLDKDKFPTYDLSVPLECTQRELTLKLIKQHNFLLHRIVAMTETMVKSNLAKYGVDGASELMKDVEAEETLTRQDVSIRSLKRENSQMKKQLESVRLQIAEKGEEVETQANFIENVKE